MDLSLRQLEYVVALAEVRHFGRAAEACHVSQPALSTQVRELEKRLGVPLFERGHRQVHVTPAGQRVVEAARGILTRVGELREVAASFAHPQTGVVRLGVIPTISPYLLPRIMPEVRRQLPELRLLLREEQTHRLVELAQQGELDLLLLALEAELDDLDTLPLFRDRFAVAIPAAHRLASRKRIHPRDLVDEELLLLEDGHCLRDQTLPICEAAGASELADFRATSLSTLMRMVSSGVALTIVPELAVESEVRAGDPIVVRPFSGRALSRTIGLAWRKTSPHKETFQLLGKLIRDVQPVPHAR